MTKVVARWYGGFGYSFGDETDLEAFASVAAAKRALRERYASNGVWRQTFAYVNRPAESVFCPCVSPDTEMWVWVGWLVEEDGTVSVPELPDVILSLGPRGGARAERV